MSYDGVNCFIDQCRLKVMKLDGSNAIIVVKPTELDIRVIFCEERVRCLVSSVYV